jgi:hypothetical protein
MRTGYRLLFKVSYIHSSLLRGPSHGAGLRHSCKSRAIAPSITTMDPAQSADGGPLASPQRLGLAAVAMPTKTARVFTTTSPPSGASPCLHSGLEATASLSDCALGCAAAVCAQDGIAHIGCRARCDPKHVGSPLSASTEVPLLVCRALNNSPGALIAASQKVHQQQIMCCPGLVSSLWVRRSGTACSMSDRRRAVAEQLRHSAQREVSEKL